MTSTLSEIGEFCGNRIKIRRFLTSDICDQYISWLNDDELMKYSNQRFVEHNTESVNAYISTFKQSSNLFLAIESLEAGDLVGTMTVYYNPNHQTADLGILIGKPGHGYGSDSWRTLADWVCRQEKVRKLTAGCVAENQAMVRLAEMSGMTLEATRKEQELISGKPVDILYFAKFTDV